MVKPFYFTALIFLVLAGLFSSCKKKDNAPIPVACIQVNNTSVKFGTPLSFSSCASDASTYLWDFGDSATAGTASASHTFTNPGTYTVKLIVTNATGSDDTTIRITVSNAAPADFVADYYVSDECTSGDFDYQASIVSGTSTNQLLIRNFDRIGYDSTVVAAIKGDSIIIATQTVDNHVILGSGFITASLKRINLSFTINGISCSGGWLKK